ncbi:MAG: YigZ family protein [Marinicellaceae bacterium]
MIELKQLDKIYQNEEVIKKSTFIAIVAPVTSVEKAMAFIQLNSQQNVTHNCWAYKVGQNYRFNDDGEPSGTAGMPILKAIEGQGFDNTAALVIRHYGGIKLGTGGLMRAYGGSVNRCLQEAGYETIQSLEKITLLVPFQYTQSIHNLVKKFEAEISSEIFNELGALISIDLLSKIKEKFEQESINLSKGTIQLKVIK